MKTLFDLFDEAGREPSQEGLAPAGDPFAKDGITEAQGGTPPGTDGGEVLPVEALRNDKFLPFDERRFCSHVFAFLKKIPSLEDQVLVDFMSYVSMAEQRMFILRGACALERIKRVMPDPAKGPRSAGEEKKGGKTVLMKEMARVIGVSPQLLARDVQIVSTFFREGCPILARENLLAREYYVTALAAPEPVAALGTAIERGAPSDFSRAEFRDYVRGLKESSKPSGVVRYFPKRSRVLHVEIPSGARDILAKLVGATGRTEEELVAEALSELWQLKFEQPLYDHEYEDVPF